jgi:DNA-binding FrmR family transcriptional regulator
MFRAAAEWIDLISNQRQVRIGTQIGCDLLGARLIDADLPRLKRRIRRLEFVPNLLPGHRFLSEATLRQRRGQKMPHIDKEKQKLVARIKRIRGQVDAIERSLTNADDCADVLMLLANVRGGINSLMAEVLEDHIRLHMMAREKGSAPSQDLAEDLIDLVRAYLK